VASGNAGAVTITAGSLTLQDRGFIATDTFGSGNAGNVDVTATGTIALANGSIDSQAQPGSTGRSGTLSVSAQDLNLTDGGQIATNSTNANPAGDIAIHAPVITVDGLGSEITSANVGTEGGSAGTIVIETDPITLSNGGAITTDSASGAAGDITLLFDKGGVLTLEGATSDGKITTTSATATAGKITIIGPSAIVLNGGQIQALGPFKGAFVTIQSGAIVESSDRLNGLDVAGTLVLDSTVEDVSQAVTLSDASFIDASKVLRGRCAAQAASGETSTLVATPTGPYRNPSATSRPSGAVAQWNTTVSACGPAPGPN
jgi:large exoprotein involved in heme utilization and adhesion